MRKLTLARGHSRLKTLCALAALLANAGCAAAPTPTAQAMASANTAGTICAQPVIGIAPDGYTRQTMDCSDDAISNISEMVSSGNSHF